MAVTTAGLGIRAAEPSRDRGGRLARKIGISAVVLALVSGLVTFLVLTGQTSLAPTRGVMVATLLANLVSVLILCGLIGVEVVRLLNARRRGKAAARLHVRIVGLFSVVAVVPAIVVAAFASITLSQNLDRLFSARLEQIFQNSIAVAQAYVREHQEGIRNDARSLARALDSLARLYAENPQQFQNQFTAQAFMLSIEQAALLRPDGGVALEARTPSKLAFVPPDEQWLQAAQNGGVIIKPGANTNRVGALLKLTRLPDLYLYVTRPIDPSILAYVRQTEEGAEEFRRMASNERFGAQAAFALTYLIIALIVLVSAIWIGFAFANHFVTPIRRLIGAADEVARGNFNISLPVRQSHGDLANLSQTFNTMSAELREQRQELINANRMIDRRRRFTEAVLSGVTAGVIGVDPRGLVTLANRSAELILGIDQAQLLNRPLLELVPELKGLVESSARGGRLAQGQVTFHRGAEERIVSVRVTSEQSDAPGQGFVVTLDDITELMLAQRTSAWADVARRIAHEIKNPLTPIQLSAERLKRKYGRVITADRDVFDQCTDTIIRQVGDIGRMVDEFSSFARMPKPVLEPEDLTETVKQATFLQQVAHPEIEFDVVLPSKPLIARFDRRLISQSVTNIVKNATEAVAALPEDKRAKGRIAVGLWTEAGYAFIDVTDTGVGLPADNRQKLLEPYMTTRAEGTGLGLAIVRKIMEDHGGRIELMDGPELEDGRRGALVRLVFPLRVERSPQAGSHSAATAPRGADPADQRIAAAHGA